MTEKINAQKQPEQKGRVNPTLLEPLAHVWATVVDKIGKFSMINLDQYTRNREVPTLTSLSDPLILLGKAKKLG